MAVRPPFDLVLVSPPLTDDLESCRVMKDVHHVLDDLTILSVFSFVLQLCQYEPRLLWKKAKEEAVKQTVKEFSTFTRNFSSIPDIDFCVNFLYSWRKKVIDEHVLWSKPVPFHVIW